MNYYMTVGQNQKSQENQVRNNTQFSSKTVITSKTYLILLTRVYQLRMPLSFQASNRLLYMVINILYPSVHTHGP